MIRLFLSLFILIFIITAIYVSNVQSLAEFALDDTIEDLREYQTGGIIQQLDIEIAGLNELQRTKKIQQLQHTFKYEINLLPLATLSLSDYNKKQLQKGKFVSVTKDYAEFNYHVSAISDTLIWKLQIESTMTERDQNFLKGPLHILTSRLLRFPEKQWQSEVAKLDQQFKMPLTLLALDDESIKLHLSEQQHQTLESGESVLFYNDDYIQYAYSRIAESNYVLKIGKMEYPLILIFFNYIVISLLALLVGIAIWLWLRPVWRDLRNLKKVSEAFGNGDLNARVNQPKYSFIKTILQSFNAMANHIEQLIVSHKMLTNAVSHELRTPVSRLRFGLEMLEKTGDESDKKRYLQSMSMDINELDEMLTELLSYARMDRQQNQINTQAVALIDWLGEREEKWANSCNNISLDFSHSQLNPKPIKCIDPKLMARALDNLLQNACRYAKQQIRIHLSYHNNHYHLTVEDDGCGIPIADHDKIFEPFTRIDDSRNRDSGGYGLGLSIVKQITKAHHGTIEVTNSKLGGACFHLRWKQKGCESILSDANDS